jgi:large subunit ribosomal protein L40
MELERQYHAMAAACEELRIGAGDGGRLFRKSMMKTGTWSTPERGGGVPIDYARGMMEWVGGPGVGAGESGGKPRIWDHDWKKA